MIKYINEIREEVLPQNIIIYIIANKIDMEDQRKVDKEEGKKLAEELGFHYMETQVKYGINVNETFEDLDEKIDKVNGKEEQKHIKKKLEKKKWTKGKNCY